MICQSNKQLKAFDLINKTELEVTYESLINLMHEIRQIDLILNEQISDEDGYRFN